MGSFKNEVKRDSAFVAAKGLKKLDENTTKLRHVYACFNNMMILHGRDVYNCPSYLDEKYDNIFILPQ